MPDAPTLRRPRPPRLTRHTAPSQGLGPPGFLIHAAHVIPMNPDPVINPPDPLEQAVASGKIWEEGHTPVEIDRFDAREDVLSLVLGRSQQPPVFTLRKTCHDSCVHVLANGQTLARIHDTPSGISLSDIRILNLKSAP